MKTTAGATIAIKSAKVVGTDSVVLTLEDAQAQSTNAKLIVKNVKTTTGVAVPEVTKEVKFMDVTAPTADDIQVVAPRVLRVNFSEPLATVPTFKLNDGQTAIVNTEFTPGNSYVDLTIGVTPENGSSHKLSIVNGTDFATFKVAEVTKSFTYNADVTAPKATVKVLSATQVKVEFSEEVTNLTDANVKFYHTAKTAAYELTKSGGSTAKEIILTLPAGQVLPEGEVKVLVDYANENGTQLQDLFGNKFAKTELTGSFVADKTAPVVNNIEGKSNNTIDVTFNETVTGADNIANYVLKDATGETVAISDASLQDAAKNIYRITTSSQLNGGSYSLTVKNVQDASANKIAEVTKTFSVADTVAPSLASTTPVQLLGAQKVKINFTEAMDKASIENKNNYLVGSTALNSKVTVTATDNNKSVILDFTNVKNADDAAQASISGKTIKVLRVADAAGNLIVAPSTDVVVPGSATAPLFDKAEATGKNTIKLYFKELITGAEANDFTIGGLSKATVTNISNDVVNGNSVLTLTTEGDIASTVSSVTVSTTGTVDAKNAYGVSASLSSEVVGDKFAPEATVATAIDNDGNSQVDRFTVEFSEDLYVASVQESDFTVDGYEITGVSVAGDTVTLAVKEKVSSDLTAQPKVTLVGTVEDEARNGRSKQDALTAVAAQIAADAAAKATAITAANTELAKLNFNTVGSITDATKLATAKSQVQAATTKVDAAKDKGAVDADFNATNLAKVATQKTEIARYEAAAAAKAAAITAADADLAKLTFNEENSINDETKLATAKSQVQAATTKVDAAKDKGAVDADFNATNFAKLAAQKTEITRYEDSL